MSRPRQLALELPHRVSHAAEDFIEAAGNARARAWVARWPDWPGGALALHGPPGCGKSHLAAIWAQGAQARPIGPAELTDGELRAGLPPRCALLLEDLERTVPGAPELEQGLLHLINRLVGRRGSLLLTARRPPARWECRLADLQSRLGAVNAVALEAPDDALLTAVLVKHFADRQLSAPPEVIRYLLPRMERSFEAARGVVAALDRAALAGRREITLPLARKVLEARAEDD